MASKIAFLVGGTHSGCGKTTVTLALMAAFQARGLQVQPFKIGPDFIDPGFHTRLTGRTSRNLDGWMLSRDYNVDRFLRSFQESQVAIVEGVMGLFDGYDGASEAGSSAEMAKWLGLPVILVVDAGSMARSAAALVYGYCHFDQDLRVTGVIFNRVGSPGHFQYLQSAMAASLPSVPVLGGIPRDQEVSLPERHLGLVMADELALDKPWAERLGELAERHIDLAELSALAGWDGDYLSRKTNAAAPVHPRRFDPDSPGSGVSVVEPSSLYQAAENPEASLALAISSPKQGAFPVTWDSNADRIVLAVPRDAAFCFYYEDNLDAVRDAGADLRFFSPLAGESLPQGTVGIYLGGGYPELHAERLARQLRFLDDLRRAAREGMPIYAECGGMMVLSRFIVTRDSEQFPMAGVLPFGTRMLKRRKALGYTEVLIRKPCLLGEVGVRMRGHEFHYSEIVEQEDQETLIRSYELQARHGTASVLEGFQIGAVLASYVHIHFGSNLDAASHLVEACRRFREKMGPHGGNRGTEG
ncbi:MAG TPA: cobyrinate a,c-diamide synthase [Syntrophobacteraceae bacterium]|nr:cobyrinate a,c-diamide synthase [Syntrophobacteraceae bacterium]